MTGAGYVYGAALYRLAREESLARTVLEELEALEKSFSQEPDFLRLMAGPNLSKEERRAALDRCFRGNVHGYVLNFLKLLMEKGRFRQFPRCVSAFRELYYEECGILPVQATTAVPLTPEQAARLEARVGALTGKKICLTNRVDPAVLGGVRLDYDGKRLDGTVTRRLEGIRSRLADTVL